jgi:glutamate carboxypeptidase
VSNGHSSSEQGVYDILLLGHIDTVFQEGTAQVRPFSIIEGRGMGPGVVDMKAGLMTILHVAETLQEFGITDKLSLCIALNSDEETGSEASRAWIETLARKSRRVFVFEYCRPSGHHVLQRRGIGEYQIFCYGKAAHAGVEPEKGTNAIVELAHQILKVSTYANPELGTTVNVTLISGGTKSNTIPESAAASIDIRVTELSEAQRIEELFKRLSKQTYEDGTTVEVTGGLNRPPMVLSEKTLHLWDQIAAIGTQLGIEMKWTATGGGSDGNFTAALGIPTIDGLGPIGGAVHTSDEYVQLDSIIPKIQLICHVCTACAEGKLI